MHLGGGVGGPGTGSPGGGGLSGCCGMFEDPTSSLLVAAKSLDGPCELGGPYPWG